MAAGNPQNTNELDAGEESQSTPSKKKAGKKVNSGSSKKMTAKEQSERFIETALQLGVDESGQAFEQAILELKIKL